MSEVDFEVEAMRLGLPLAMKSKSACATIGCGQTKLRELIHEGRLDARKSGKDLLIMTSSILRYRASLPRALFVMSPKKSASANV